MELLLLEVLDCFLRSRLLMSSWVGFGESMSMISAPASARRWWTCNSEVIR